MVVLSSIEQKDISDIVQWPQYEGVYAQMDYAVRKNGWLDICCNNPNKHCYAAKVGSQCIGFSLLIQKGISEAEFRIAVHPDHLSSGYGGEITRKTIRIGFLEHKLRTINLIVRKNNPIALRLYVKHGFTLYGETRENIQGHCIDFFMMATHCEDFKRGEI